MTKKDDFDLMLFMPYLLNQAAEESSLAFQQHYKQRYGMLRTEWRVLFHLGYYKPMTAREMCDRAKLHKTKVSRAVTALEKRRYLKREKVEWDRRQEILTLTPLGQSVYRDLKEVARDYDKKLQAQFTAEEDAILRKCLKKLAGF